MNPTVVQSLRQLTQAGEPDVLAEVLSMFVTQAEARLDAIDSATRASDAAALQHAAHALKGAAGAVGAGALQEACRELEECARRGALKDALGGAAVVRREYGRVKVEIDQLL